MKINGPNQTHLNPYQKQIQNQKSSKQMGNNLKDQLQISERAKQMQESSAAGENREARLEKIKLEVQSGKYQIDYEKTAEKMLDFWTGK